MNSVWLNTRFQILRRIGVSGLMGLLLLAVAGMTAYFLIPKAKKQSLVLQQEQSVAKDSVTKANELRRKSPNTVSQLQNFLNWLPPLASNAQDVDKLFSLAIDSGIELQKVDYQLTTEPGAQFLRYQVTVPVKDKYLAVRQFASGALNSLPHLALDELQFSRPQSTADVVDAQLRFTFFYRAE